MNERPSSTTARSAWDEAAAQGIDMSLIEANLRRSPIERIRVHDRALAAAVQLKVANGVNNMLDLYPVVIEQR